MKRIEPIKIKLKKPRNPIARFLHQFKSKILPNRKIEDEIDWENDYDEEDEEREYYDYTK